jgi:hypothetical protein
MLLDRQRFFRNPKTGFVVDRMRIFFLRVMDQRAYIDQPEVVAFPPNRRNFLNDMFR